MAGIWKGEFQEGKIGGFKKENEVQWVYLREDGYCQWKQTVDTVDYNYKKWQVSHSITWDGDLDDFFMKVTRPGPGTWRIEQG